MIIAAATAVAAAGTVAGAMAIGARRRREAAVELARREGQIGLDALGGEAEAARDAALERAERLRGRLERQLATETELLTEDEARLAQMEAAAARRDGNAEERDRALGERAAEMKDRRIRLDALREEIDGLERRIVERVEEVAGESRDDLSARIGESLTGDARVAAEKAARVYEERVQSRAEVEARRLMDLAMYRYGVAKPADRLIATVDLPRKPAARERFLADGRALMLAITEYSEVEFLPQEGKDGFYMQAPNPYVREVGRLAFERLARRKDPSVDLVAQYVEKARVDLEKICRDAGKRATRILKLRNVHGEIQFLVGKLLYRTSYTQNQWQHAIETAHLCGMMASDLGLDIRTAHRSALMHDIGKVLWAETEAVGSHAVSGAAFATAHGEAPEIVHPIAAHHNDEKPSSALAHLVAAADALSGARPGARRETIESYSQRVEDVQNICDDFKPRGIRNTYVISGGREVRVVVDPRRVDDLAAARLANDIAYRIEDECIYPGQIKVMVIRETQATATARR